MGRHNAFRAEPGEHRVGRRRPPADLAPDFRNSYVDEWTVGVDQYVLTNYLVRFNIVRRYDKDRSQLINAAQPFDASTHQSLYRIPVRTAARELATMRRSRFTAWTLRCFRSTTACS